MNLPEKILNALNKHGKCQDDISYIVYALGNTLQSLKHYCCTLQNFFDITKSIQTPFDLNWYFEIKIVGDDFWLTFDNQGELIFHQAPVPPLYRRLRESEITKNIEDFV